MVLAFVINGRVADVDNTTADEPYHPATAVIVEVGDALTRVIVPASVLQERLELLCPGRPVRIVGEVAASAHDGRIYRVASDLRLQGPTN